MSPSTSWLLFGGWLLAVVLITLFLAGGNESRDPEPPFLTYSDEPRIKVWPAVHDWEQDLWT